MSAPFPKTPWHVDPSKSFYVFDANGNVVCNAPTAEVARKIAALPDLLRFAERFTQVMAHAPKTYGFRDGTSTGGTGQEWLAGLGLGNLEAEVLQVLAAVAKPALPPLHPSVVDVQHETAYGSTARLSQAVRVF